MEIYEVSIIFLLKCVRSSDQNKLLTWTSKVEIYFLRFAIINGIVKKPIVPMATIVMYVIGFPTGSCAGGTKERTNAKTAARIPTVAKRYKTGAL